MAKNNKVIKEQNIDQNLQERYEEMNDFLLDLIEDHKRAEEDLKYLKDFVHYKRLDEDGQMPKSGLEALGGPMEDRKVTISRLRSKLE